MSSNNTVLDPVLSEEQLETFYRDGFVVVKVFEEEDFEPVKDVITSWIDRRVVELQEEGVAMKPYVEVPFEQRAAKMLAQASNFFDGFDLNTGLLSPEVFSHMSHPRMVSAVSQILGEKISLNPVMHIRVKPPHDPDMTRTGFDNVPWHQDAGVYTEDSDGTMILTCWRPICGATELMGCMELIPGVEGPEPLLHEGSSYGTSIYPEELPETSPVPAPCKPGEVVIMHQYTPHRSGKNLSDLCRWSMDIRYHVEGAPSGRPWQPEAPLTGDKRFSGEDWVEAWRACMARGDMRTKHRVTPRAEVS